jgi:excisionase family DNA binding protein
MSQRTPTGIGAPSEGARTPALLKDFEAAAYLAIGVTTLKRLTRLGWLPVVMLTLGSRRAVRRWSRAALDRFIEQREQGGHLARIADQVIGVPSRPARERIARRR